jgi:peptidoglycan-associated lipoprotein
MRLKDLVLLATITLVGACASATEEVGSVAGGGKIINAKPAETYTTPIGKAIPKNAPGSQEDLEAAVGARVFFALDQHQLDDKARATLDGQAAWLTANPNVMVAVEGHCDERGTRDYNLALGDRRANSVKDYLTFLGIGVNRIKTISYGKERPRALGSNEAAWAQNRRSETSVMGAGS